MKKYPTKKVCETYSVSRSNQYRHPSPRPKRYKRQGDAEVLAEIREVTGERSTYGYPRVTGVLRRQRREENRSMVNPKRVYRLMEMNNLLLRYASKRPKRPHFGNVITLHSDTRYCSDIFEFKCDSGEEIHVAFSLDCHDREAISFVARPFDLSHEDILRLMDETATRRFGRDIEKLPHPIQWLSDNGPQYTAKETKVYGEAWGYDVRTTPAYSPESNGASEAFVKTFKRDYIYANPLPANAAEALKVLPKWFEDYNEKAPHSGLKYLSPREYRKEQNKKEKNELITDDLRAAIKLRQGQVWDDFKKMNGNPDGSGLVKTG